MDIYRNIIFVRNGQIILNCSFFLFVVDDVDYGVKKYTNMQEVEEENVEMPLHTTQVIWMRWIGLLRAIFSESK